MSGPSEDTDKSHEPTQRKLQQARDKGEIARTPDLLTALVYGGVLLTSVAFGPALATGTAEVLLPLLDQPDRLVAIVFDGSATPWAGGLIVDITLVIVPWMLVPAGLVIGALLATRGIAIAPSKLAPRLSRISPISNAKNKYGRRGLFEFAKSAAKMSIYAGCLAAAIGLGLNAILQSAAASSGMIAPLLAEQILRLLSIIFPIALAIGAVDAVWQHAEHRRQNRMSHKEMRDEFKDVEGDPTMKQERRQRAQAIATAQMMADVPKADVVIVNPEHYAVALKWARTHGAAPVCVAKGVDHVAARIRERAEAAGVPIRPDPPTARAIHATVEIGDEITPELYRAVAAAIRFAEEMRRKARGMAANAR